MDDLDEPIIKNSQIKASFLIGCVLYLSQMIYILLVQQRQQVGKACTSLELKRYFKLLYY